ncbi:hypothetical protein [Peribacillus butanolivorans]|nr:hypothetical protein [Peribacillus butanolivorans]
MTIKKMPVSLPESAKQDLEKMSAICFKKAFGKRKKDYESCF